MNVAHAAARAVAQCNARAAAAILLMASCALSAQSQTINLTALATVNAATCRLDKSDLGWTTGMAMTPYPWGRHPTAKNSYYFNGFIADPTKGAVLLYQIGAGEGVMQQVREGAAERESVLKYITMNYHVKEKLVLGKDYADRGYPKLYAVSGTQGEMKTLGYAGYAKGYLLYFAFNLDPKEPLDAAWLDRLFTKWLARFPNVEGVEALAVKVFPAMQDSASAEGLTAAAEQLPALLMVQGMSPDVSLTATLSGATTAELRAGGASGDGKTLTLKADGSGRAEIKVVPKITERFAKPFTVRVRIQSSDGKSLEATVHVGLALSFSEINPVKGSGLNAVRAPWPLLIGVRSASHPEINVSKFIERAEKSGAWGDQTLGLLLKAEWINQPSSSPDDDAYAATTNVYFHGKVAGNTILVANGNPQYRVESFTYPSVVLNSEGEHIYHVTALPVVMNVSDKSSVAASRQGKATSEPWVTKDRVVVLTGNNPDTWFNVFSAGACALEPTDVNQEILIGILKTFPPTAGLTGDITGLGSIACNVAKGEYASAFLDLAKTVGTKYIERLADENAIKNLTPREQQLVKVAKAFTDEVDKSEKSDEREKLKNNLKKKYDAEIKAIWP